MDIEVEGATEVKADINNLIDDLGNLPGMEEVTDNYVKVAKRLAPKRSGYLARSIKPAPDKKVKEGVTVGGAMATARYAAAINYGTGPRKGKKGPHNIKGNYFMNDADEVLQHSTPATLEKSIEAMIAKRGLEQ